MNIQDAFIILKSNQYMDYREVRSSYRDLVSVWHPDRFTHNERLRKKAIEEMKQINIAWEIIEKNLKVRSKSTLNTHQLASKKKNKSVILIQCNNCGTINRILNNKSMISSIKCGKCQENLRADCNSTQRKHKETFEERSRAADSCSGRIQTDGHCNKYREALKEAHAFSNKKIDLIIVMSLISGALIFLFSCFLWPENNSSQLHYKISSSPKSKTGTKEFPNFNIKGPELPLSSEGKTQNITSKDIIVPFEIIKK